MLFVQIVVSFLEVMVSVGLFLPNLRRGTDTSSQSTFLIQKASALDMNAGPSHKQHTSSFSWFMHSPSFSSIPCGTKAVSCLAMKMFLIP